MIKLIKSFIRNHFGFSRAETNGMVLLFPFLLLTIFSPFLINQYLEISNTKPVFDEKSAIQWKKELEKKVIILKPTKKKQAFFYKNSKKKKVTKRKFVFNPNKVTKKEIIELGFSQRVANNWSKFIAAGGKFYEQKDLMKVYGIDSTLLSSLESFVQFPKNAVDPTKEEFQKKDFKPFKIAFKETNLNSTDREDLKKISGIGDKLSERIIKFRDKLGGFHSMRQLNEVYGLDSTIIQKIGSHFHINDSINRIFINQISKKELANHPYFSYKTAQVIVNYREQHGHFQKPDDLKKIHIINDSIVSKISPYLQFE